MAEPAPEPDQIEGAPHPREAPAIFGQGVAEAGFLQAFNSGRLHHGWLLTGPRGVGKATLAWRIARFLLAQPQPGEAGLFGAPPEPDSLDIAPDHPVARPMLAQSEPRLKLIRRTPNERGVMRQVIAVEDVRALRDFFGLSATDGGRRVVIVDAADEMNPNAANAILKLLEEPPAGAVLLLVSHQPSRLLPTIRSRCRVLKLAPLDAAAMAAALDQAGAGDVDAAALAALSGGSVGEALRLLSGNGLELYGQIAALLAAMPGAPRPDLIRLADSAAGRGSEGRFDLIVRLTDLAVARLARAGASGVTPDEAVPGEAAMMARLARNAGAARVWADLAADLGARARAGKAVNLDPAALVIDMFLRMETAARSLAR
ncbi:DNA polymerase III subunit delta' [Pararhodobacter sp. SW119]|uniref:DNA polymerase III subunit delta' n=1 Tax=Pararhodobacter sp. SW119 TaxID=2780075 RepID=UPI001ADF1789|nr:DNA polymerase III subunit delta' [Pararhodobacter sp. SW119]